MVRALTSHQCGSSRNRTRATLGRGECSHHGATPAPPDDVSDVSHVPCCSYSILLSYFLSLGMKLVSSLIRIAKIVHIELDHTQVCRLLVFLIVCSHKKTVTRLMTRQRKQNQISHFQVALNIIRKVKLHA